jgi:hypothetical protein
MKKILSLAFIAAFVVALGASVGCEDKKTSAPAKTTPAGPGTGTKATT